MMKCPGGGAIHPCAWHESSISDPIQSRNTSSPACPLVETYAVAARGNRSYTLIAIAYSHSRGAGSRRHSMRPGSTDEDCDQHVCEHGYRNHHTDGHYDSDRLRHDHVDDLLTTTLLQTTTSTATSHLHVDLHGHLDLHRHQERDFRLWSARLDHHEGQPEFAPKEPHSAPSMFIVPSTGLVYVIGGSTPIILKESDRTTSVNEINVNSYYGAVNPATNTIYFNNDWVPAVHRFGRDGGRLNEQHNRGHQPGN